jgi:hypothetical protein
MEPILRYALASQAAYQPVGALRAAALADIGLTVVSESPDGRGIIARDDTTSVAIFRGTDDVADLRVDGDVALAGTPLVHKGFLDAWGALVPWFEEANWHEMPLNWIYTGHSLGGALATLAACQQHPFDMECWTYGSPKCGLGAFVSQYKALGFQTTRVVHDLDCIPTLPLSFPLLDWQHVIPPLRINDQGQIAPEVCGLTQCVADMDGAALAAHHVDLYVNALKLFSTSTAFAKEA